MGFSLVWTACARLASRRSLGRQLTSSNHWTKNDGGASGNFAVDTSSFDERKSTLSHHHPLHYFTRTDSIIQVALVRPLS